MELVVQFDSAIGSDAAVVGGKGANLGILTRAGFPVPAGFTVTTAAYGRFLAETGLGAQVQAIVSQIDFSDATNVDKRCAEVRSLIEAAAVPISVAAAIAGHYGELGAGGAGDQRVAVRSSGTAEDLEGASFAGQHDTYLHIRGVDAVINAVQRCWASLWTARATAYRAHKGFAQDEVGIAVVVQTMVDAEVAGVMFTANPIAALTDEIGINASWGLGETVVSGMITPDAFMLDKATLAIKDRTLGAKETRIRLDDTTGAGTIHEDVPQADRDRYCLADDQLRELGTLGKQVMAHYDGLPQDTEWALADGHLYILQSRPVTGAVLAWDEDVEYWQQGPHDPTTIWSRKMADDGWNGAITPLFFSIRAPGWYGYHVFGNKLFGLPEVAARRQIKYYRATMYLSVESETEWVTRFAPKAFRPRMLQNVDPLRHEEVLNAPSDYLGLAKMLARIHLLEPKHGVTAWVKVQDDYTYNRGAEAVGRSKEEIQALSDTELVKYIEERVAYEIQYIEDLLTGYYVHMTAAAQLLVQVVTTWYTGAKSGVLMDLLTGSETTTATTTENLALWNMSRTIYNSPELTALFRAHSGAEFLAHLESSDAGRDFKKTYDAFVRDHGPRGHADRDIYYTRRCEDPALDYRVFAAFLGADPDHDPESIEHAARIRKHAAVEEILANLRGQPLGFLKSEIFRILNAYSQKLLTERDNSRAHIDITTYAYKVPLVELNRRAMERGVFEDGRDYFFLSRSELYTVFFASATSPLDRAKIAGRKHNFDLMAAKDRPNPVYLRDNRELVLDDGTDDGALRGIPTSGGVATGTARLVKDLEEIGRVKQGEIMVCNSTDPGWTPIFLLLAGAVFETGGAFSHCSCISREYGIPAIQVPGALHKIPDGATISIDGNTGTITVHDLQE